ncbi:MAG: hypothetical protein NT137_05350 [Methanomassiliicoccales archaeon]|nr:hypothetical protein [Methanomassiliicoccales archaeon]
MTDWMARVKGDSTDWLLNEDNPSVRYLALKDLLGRRESDEELSEARRRIMEMGMVPRVLAKQRPEGHWGRPEDFYMRSKYKGTVWNLILLAELSADPEDARVKAACEFVLRWSQERASGGFSVMGSVEAGGRKGQVLSCLTGNMAFSLIQLGYGEDRRVKKALDWITTYQRYELVSRAPRVWPYLYERCWRDHTCRSGAVKSLKALAEVPEGARTKEMRARIEEGAEYILAQHIFRKPPDLVEVSRKEWLNLGFPLIWNTDVLEILWILARLGIRDERMRETVEAVLSKQGEDGRWRQENRFEGRFITSIERNGRESKWVTLNALRTLKALSG